MLHKYLKVVFPKADYFIQGAIKMSSYRQNFQTDIPKGRSKSRIKNASQSQGFANKDLYGSSVQTGTVNGQFYKSKNNNQKASHRQNTYVNNSRNNEYRKTQKQSRRKMQNNNGEMSESTMVKVIVGSILGAVLLAIIIIIALVIMNFQL